MIEYPIGASGQVVALTAQPLAHFAAHRQTSWWHREAGGQLFARFNDTRIVVELATGPHRSDRRARYSFEPDPIAQQREIDEQFERGLLFVGDWHSHPENVPSPSITDANSIADCVRRSRHKLNGFILVIVGRRPAPAGLSLSIADERQIHPLTPAGSADVASESPPKAHS